jgi:hypothetical protein
MATMSAVFHPSDDAAIRISGLATLTASSEQVMPAQRLFAINADQDVTITFGQQGNVPVPGVASFRIPQGSTLTFDIGTKTAVRLFNLSSTQAATIYIMFLNKN